MRIILPFFTLLLFASPFFVSAQVAPTTEVNPACYSISGDNITFYGPNPANNSGWISCLDHKHGSSVSGITVYFANYDITTSPVFVSDSSNGKYTTEVSDFIIDLTCDSPSQCTHGFGETPTEGQVMQFRYSTGYLSGTFATVTLIYENGQFQPHYDYTSPPPPEPTATGFNGGVENTRFLNVVLSEPQNNSDIQFDVTYFLDPNELDPNKSSKWPNLINLKLAERPDSNFVTYGFSIDPNITGTSTLTFTVNDSNLLSNNNSDTIYDSLIEFGNKSSIFGAEQPFPDAYVYFDFTLTNGHLTSVSTVEYYDANTFIDTDSSFDSGVCSLTSIGSCFTGAFVYLFIPPDGFIGSLFATVSEADNAMLDNAFETFDLITDASVASPDGNTFNYTLDIPQANINVEMFSMERMTHLFGDSLPIFRSIMIVALWFGFLSMIIRSIWRRIGAGDDTFDGSGYNEANPHKQYDRYQSGNKVI